jgi:hypothetical protein
MIGKNLAWLPAGQQDVAAYILLTFNCLITVVPAVESSLNYERHRCQYTGS